MILSGYSWAEVLSWLIGLLVLYEVSVYVIFTYGKKLFGPPKKGFELDDGHSDESTESRIAHIDEMDDTAYENNEFKEIGENYFENDSGGGGDEITNSPPIVKTEPVLGSDQMYHSTVKDSPPEEGSEKSNDDEDDSPPDDEDDNLPQNIETKIVDEELTEIESNYEKAEGLYDEETAADCSLFSGNTVVKLDVLGDDDDSDSGYLPKSVEPIEKIDTEADFIDQKDCTFEEPYDIADELESNKEKANSFTFSEDDEDEENEQKNVKRRVITNRESEHDADETPYQEEP